jgi:small-conductance mechanosensitive channel
MADNIQLIKEEAQTIKQITVGSLQQAYYTIVDYLPHILGALVLLLVGWLVAMLLRKFTGKALRVVGVDVLAERTGLTAVLARGGICKRPSELLGWGLYWLILLSALVAMFNALGLEIASLLLQAIVRFIPHLLVGLLLLGLGFFASRYIDTMVTATAAALQLPAPDAWGRVAQGLILFMAGVMALSELGIATRVVNLSFLIVLAVAGSAAVVAFGLGTKDVVGQLAAGQCLRHLLQPGDVVQVADHEGMVQEIGFTHVSLHTAHGSVAIPNTLLLQTTLVKRRPETLLTVTSEPGQSVRPKVA